MLTQKELTHYSRHTVIPQFGLEGQEKLKESRVLIIGMGGLGSPVALYLAASGVGKLVIADNDTIAASNLQRQIIHKRRSIGRAKVESAKETIEELNPWVNVIAINDRLQGAELDNQVKESDLVVCCCDNYISRFEINRACVKYSKPLVSGAAVRLQGQVAVYNLTKTSACYQCLYQPDTHIDSCDPQGVLSPLVGTVGSLQATEALKILIGMGKPLDNQLLIYDVLNSEFKKLNINKNPSCPICQH